MKYLKYFENSNNVLYTNKNVNIGDIYDESNIYVYCQNLHRIEEDFWGSDVSDGGDLGERIESFIKYEVAEIPINKIETDEYYLDDSVVEEYIDKYNEIKTYPPIVLGYYGYGKYDIIDGNHRANALKKLGFETIICFVGLNYKQKTVK